MICKYCHEKREQHLILGALIALGCKTDNPDECKYSPDGKHHYEDKREDA